MSILKLLGVGVGCIGLSFDDFCLLLPGEFEAICDQWQQMRQADRQSDWERTRISAAIGIQPHVKNRVTPRQLLPLPWDEESPRMTKDKKTEAPASTRERFEQLQKRVDV